MEKNIEHTYREISKDLDTRWIELSQELRHLSAALTAKAADSPLLTDLETLTGKTELLCEHVERIHQDVLDLLANLDTRLEPPSASPDLPEEEIAQEKIQIQNEQHDAQANFKDIIKALFMYVDDPKERVAQKKQSTPSSAETDQSHQ